jgi:DNA topoisomerase I
VVLKKGPFGHYLQLGAANGETKPKRVALPRQLKAADVDLDTALRVLALPRELGRHPETGEAIIAGIGRFGSYIKHGTTFKSLAADDDVLTIGLNRAVVLLAEPAEERRRGAPRPLRELGPHPSGGTVALYQGRYGPYVSHNGAFASLPKNVDPANLSLDEAVRLLAERSSKRKAKQRERGKPGVAKSVRGSAHQPKHVTAEVGQTASPAKAVMKSTARRIADKKGKVPTRRRAKGPVSGRRTQPD